MQTARELVAVLEEKFGEDILLIDIHEIADFTDYFILANGTSDRMLDSLAKAVLEKAKGSYHLSAVVEGQSRDGWLVMDLGDIVVHLFSPDQRAYYRLEQLWEKGKILLHMQ